MVKPWTMLVASVLVLVAIIIHKPGPPDYEVPEQDTPVSKAEFELTMEQDWEYFNDNAFSLIRRTNTTSIISFEVQYNGSDIYNDLAEIYGYLSDTHIADVRILVQSKQDEELIEYICEDGKVIKSK